MRIILKLQAEKDQMVVLEQHKIMGFVYDILKDNAPDIHDSTGYKFFCFSNIFPYKNGKIKKGNIRNLIISSPSKKIIDAISVYLSKEADKTINIGENLFSIKSWDIFNISLPSRNIRLTTATPIIIRVPERRYDVYEIPKEERKRNYVYWRPKYSFEAFLKQLSENLIKKYNDFYGTEIQNYNLFEQFMFKKQVNLSIIIKGKSYGVSGSLWEFIWSYMDAVQRKIIKFGLDTGFGERNSMGFGFVNVSKCLSKRVK